MKICPFSTFLFIASSAAYTIHTYHKDRKRKLEKEAEKELSTMSSSIGDMQTCRVVFVLGGPGAGKGTQCELLTKNMPEWDHLSAGDLLRAERKKSDSELADLINSKIAAGQIVPAEITVSLLEKAMQESGKSCFLIDGFPRSEGNVTVWEEKMATHNVEFVLFLDCPEEVMTSRLLTRGKTSGRVDDNLDVIRKRFQTFRQESMPIVERYEGKGKVQRVVADRSVDDVYKEVSKLFISLK